MVGPGDIAYLRSRHLADSLALHRHLSGAARLLDIGSGGGFPGVPLAVANPTLNVTLVERNRKKCSFLRHAVMTLQIANADIINADIREVGPELGAFDAITARAVAQPAELWEWSQGLLAESGQLMLQASSPVQERLHDAEVVSHRSDGIGWISIVRRIAS